MKAWVWRLILRKMIGERERERECPIFTEKWEEWEDSSVQILIWWLEVGPNCLSKLPVQILNPYKKGLDDSKLVQVIYFDIFTHLLNRKHNCVGDRYHTYLRSKLHKGQSTSITTIIKQENMKRDWWCGMSPFLWS